MRWKATVCALLNLFNKFDNELEIINEKLILLEGRKLH